MKNNGQIEVSTLILTKMFNDPSYERIQKRAKCSIFPFVMCKNYVMIVSPRLLCIRIRVKEVEPKKTRY